MHGFFITATNTDRGKTLFTAALRLWLQKQDISCLAMKPVQTGMKQRKLSPDLYSIYALDYQSPDETQVHRDLESILPLLQPYCYQSPCSPHLSAERDGLPAADLTHIKRCAQELQELGKHCDILLVEGVGGFYVPIDRKARRTMGHVAQELGLPVLLLAQSGLGAINNACLSLMAIKQLGLPIVGFVLNDRSEKLDSKYIREDNPRIIAELSDVPYLGTLPYLANPQNSAELLQAVDALDGRERLKEYLHQWTENPGESSP